ncbi:MAG: hypothetical protein KY396_03790, partial [Actinobacteria bacterium]|nr:hypothetical protein [Actinomycetota bacterium]
FNELVLAFDRPTSRAELVRRAGAAPRDVQPLVPLFREQLEEIHRTRRPLTDDRAPVEWLIDRMIVEFVAQGGSLDEEPLPTAPG